MVTRGWGRGEEESLFNGYRVLFGGDEQLPEWVVVMDAQ